MHQLAVKLGSVIPVNRIKRKLIIRLLRTYLRLLKIRIFYNEPIKPTSGNILRVGIFTESPWFIDKMEWIREDDELDLLIAPISFGHPKHFAWIGPIYAGVDCFASRPPRSSCFDKKHLCSITASSKKEAPGHRIRHEVLSTAKNIDVFGESVKRPIVDLADVLGPYYYTICVENDRTDGYISEKFSDAIKYKTIPIYWGSRSTVERLGFDTTGIIFVEDTEGILQAIETISAEDYLARLSAVETNWHRLMEIRLDMKIGFFRHLLLPFYFRTVLGGSNVVGTFTKQDMDPGTY